MTSGTWASIDESCPMRCRVDDSDLAHLFLGEDGHSLELTVNAAALRKLAEFSRGAVAELDAVGLLLPGRGA